MSIHFNLFAGFANSICSALIGLAVVPIYLRYLGIEAYGLVGFFATMQGVLQIFDMGLAPTINREVARYAATGNIKESGRLLHTLAVVYWCMAVLIAVLIISLSPVIAGLWLKPQNLPQATLRHAITLMGLIMAFHWPRALYQGALIGAQRLTISSGINLSLSILGSLGAVAVLAFVSPAIEAFFLWQAVVGAVHVAVMWWGAWHVVGRSDAVRFDVEELRRIWRFSAGMSGIAISGLILAQLDKVLLSRILSLDDFGRYALAGVVASGLYMILSPVFSVIYPRLSALVVADDTDKLIEFYRTGTRLLVAVLFPVAAAAAVFSQQILVLWTKNQELAVISAPVVSLFLIGTALNGAMHFPYALQLAYGMTRLPLVINAILMTVMIPMTIYLAVRHGVVGGAASWAVLNGIYLVAGTWLTHRSLLKGIGFKWLLCDVMMPLCVTLTVVLGAGRSVSGFGFPPIIELCIAMVLALVAFIMIVVFSPCLKKPVRMYFVEGRL